MSIEADLAAVVSAAVAPMVAELRALRIEVAALRAVSVPQYLSVEQAAERLGVSSQTVLCMAHRGDLVSRRAGRRILIDPASLRAPTRDDVAAGAIKARGA